MIESVQFKNFKALRNTTLPLDRFTLLIGPNASGKSTALQAIKAAPDPASRPYDEVVSAGLGREAVVETVTNFRQPYDQISLRSVWRYGDRPFSQYTSASPDRSAIAVPGELIEILRRIRLYSLDAQLIAAPSQLRKGVELSHNGAGLVVVLDQLRDDHPERFEAINEAMNQWMPEFDRILFETPGEGQRAFLLRTSRGKHSIPAASLSQGALLALAMLTLSYLPDPPSIVCLEEPDRGVHPRLLRDVRDALYRLSYPENYDEDRAPVQVIATTHSPYLLDLYRDYPEHIVIADKTEQGVRFERLADQPHIDEILRDSHLGDVWYTGVLGGVPAHV